MDADIGSMIQSVLSDPAQMEKITRMAQGLMGGEPDPPKAPEPAPVSEGDTKLLGALARTLGGRSENSRSTALLMAMRPYMKPEKQEKLDRALRLTNMLRIAQAVLGQMGGGHGL